MAFFGRNYRGEFKAALAFRFVQETVHMPDADRRYALVTVVTALALVVCSSSAFASDVEHGRQLARKICSVCHVVFVGQRPGVPPAPSFRSIAKSQQFRAKGAKFLWEKHGTMPNLALTGEEADDVTAYIRSLAR